ncbi:MAG: O-antigen ligase family protein [Candidatus Omnitrophota bacterium]|nr:O-antigen ligase family protein [Candidatus Omnitrophota bacterium]
MLDKKTLKDKWINIADIIVEYCLYGAIFFIPKSKAAIEIFVCLAIFFFLIKKILKPDFKFLKSISCLFLLLFIVFSALSIFNSHIYIKKGLRALIGKWMEYAIIFLLVKDTLKNKIRFRNAIFILLIFGVVVGIDGFIQGLSGVELLWDNPMGVTNNGLAAITGPFRHHNDFGAYLLVIIALMIGIWLSDNLKFINKILLAFCIGLLLLSMLLAYSRGSWLGFIFALILMLALSRRFKLIIPLLSIFILLLFFLPGVKGRSILTFQFNSPNLLIWNDADRFRVWGVAFRMIRENPFLGKGLGTFMDYFSKYKPNIVVQYAHNCFLQIWAEAGIFSLVSFLAFAASVLFEGINKFKQNNDFVLLGLVASMFAFLVHSFFDTNLYSLQLSILFWLCMGLVSAKAR